MNETKDLRTKRTYKLLIEALFTLLQEKTFEEIKVTDICEKAMIHRTTFYTHFEDKYQLLEYSLQELTQDLNRKVLQNHNSQNLKEYYINMIELFLEHILDNQRFYLSILANNKNSVTMDMLYNLITSDIKSKIIEEGKEGINHSIPAELIAEFYVGAVFRTAIYWLKNQKICTKEELMTYINIMISKQIHIKK